MNGRAMKSRGAAHACIGAVLLCACAVAQAGQRSASRPRPAPRPLNTTLPVPDLTPSNRASPADVAAPASAATAGRAATTARGQAPGERPFPIEWRESREIANPALVSLIRNYKRDGLPVVPLWQSTQSRLAIGLNPHGVPGIFFTHHVGE